MKKLLLLPFLLLFNTQLRAFEKTPQLSQKADSVERRVNTVDTLRGSIGPCLVRVDFFNLDNLQIPIDKITDGFNFPYSKSTAVYYGSSEHIQYVKSTLLIVVDGKSYYTDEEKLALSEYDPEELVSIKAIKPRKAKKLYGEQGKDGAVIVTTNRK